MRIGVFCTNEYTTPPPKGVIYAPLVVAQQVADGLHARGHRITAYAPRGSRVASRLFTNDVPSLYNNKKLDAFVKKNRERAVASYESLALMTLIRHANEGKYDLLHIHPTIRGIFFAALTQVPVVFTMHDPLIEGKKFYYERITNPNIHFISISNAQRKPAKKIRWAGTVYNGIEVQNFPFREKPGKYFVTIGRLTPEKGIYEAIIAAKKARATLLIAGGPTNGPYWERKIKPHFSKTIRYIGMVPYNQVPELLSRARGLLFPIQWEEPFGLVMIEAMACGTPVIAFPRGSVREVLQNKKTGYIVPTIAHMVRAMKRIETIDRRVCRSYVEKRFTLATMIDGYERIFTQIVSRKKRYGD